MKLKFFISYSRADGEDFAQHLYNHLVEKKHDVFLDTSSINVGAKWRPKIESNIDSCDIFILIITAKTMESEEIEKEYSLANNKKKLMLLLKHNAIDYTKLKWKLQDKNLADFDTRSSLIRIFDQKLDEFNDLLTSDLQDPNKVYDKLKSLNEELQRSITNNNHSIQLIKSYCDDTFIPIITFLKKSPVFYQEETVAIEKIMASIIRLSQNLDENREYLDEEDIFIKNHADLLKSSLQKYVSYLLECFIKNPPDKRLQIKEKGDIENVIVEEIETETKNFLSIWVDKNISENKKHELFKQNIENGKIDIRFYFLTPESIDLWLKIINLSEYKLQKIGRELLVKNVDELVKIIIQNSPENTKCIDFVNLGIGAAVKDYYIIKSILDNMPKESSERINYIPIDYSIGILQRTIDYLDDLMNYYPNKFHIQGILGDFFELIRYRDSIRGLSKHPKLFALMGNTFGNVDEEYIIKIITKTMDTNDFLLLEVDLINNRSDDQLKEGYGTDDLTTKFLLKPILNFFGSRQGNKKINIKNLQVNIEVKNRLGSIPNSKTVTTSVTLNNDDPDNSRIDTIHSRKYDLEVLKDYLYQKKLGLLKIYNQENVCLLLLKKQV
jgi:uncharacterized SAM-dependent methyltransferase